MLKITTESGSQYKFEDGQVLKQRGKDRKTNGMWRAIIGHTEPRIGATWKLEFPDGSVEITPRITNIEEVHFD